MFWAIDGDGVVESGTCAIERQREDGRLLMNSSLCKLTE
jgi:hypothetical protein